MKWTGTQILALVVLPLATSIATPGGFVAVNEVTIRPFPERVARGRGVGTALMNAVHDVALQHGRTLLTLNTRYDLPPHHWYKTLGYKEVGVIPGWTIGPHGERFDHITLYKELKAEL